MRGWLCNSFSSSGLSLPGIRVVLYSLRHSCWLFRATATCPYFVVTNSFFELLLHLESSSIRHLSVSMHSIRLVSMHSVLLSGVMPTMALISLHCISFANYRVTFAVQLHGLDSVHFIKVGFMHCIRLDFNARCLTCCTTYHFDV